MGGGETREEEGIGSLGDGTEGEGDLGVRGEADYGEEVGDLGLERAESAE